MTYHQLIIIFLIIQTSLLLTSSIHLINSLEKGSTLCRAPCAEGVAVGITTSHRLLSGWIGVPSSERGTFPGTSRAESSPLLEAHASSPRASYRQSSHPREVPWGV